jgi:hypothetical protein
VNLVLLYWQEVIHPGTNLLWSSVVPRVGAQFLFGPFGVYLHPLKFFNPVILIFWTYFMNHTTIQMQTGFCMFFLLQQAMKQPSKNKKKQPQEDMKQ